MSGDRVLAATLVEPGKYEVREYPFPEPEPGCVVVKMELSGICGTDKHTYQGYTTQYAGAGEGKEAGGGEAGGVEAGAWCEARRPGTARASAVSAAGSGWWRKDLDLMASRFSGRGVTRHLTIRFTPRESWR